MLILGEKLSHQVTYTVRLLNTILPDESNLHNDVVGIISRFEKKGIHIPFGTTIFPLILL